MTTLKKFLFDEYGGFADKRIKDLNKSNFFIIDDRSERDFGADKGLYSYFCSVTATVVSGTELHVTLSGNIPMSDAVELCITRIGAEYVAEEYQARLELTLVPGQEKKLTELAQAIASIVVPGAPRYKVANYKYVCPRTAVSLRRLAGVLNNAWRA